jgi:hypothetical protein
MDAHIIVGKITASAEHFANLRPSSGVDLDAGADRIPIAGDADEVKADPRVATAAVIISVLRKKNPWQAEPARESFKPTLSSFAE